MARLFITSKEVHAINDWSKEFIKDVVGQSILYYPISTLKTKIHPIYEEAVQKIFENPIKINVLSGEPEWKTTNNVFGIEKSAKIEVLVQARDLLDKNITISDGDYFVYAGAVFEIVSFLNINDIFGMEEHDCSMKIIGNLARPGTFDPKHFLKAGETKEFFQQRGVTETAEGPTGDIRQNRERLGEELADVALGDGPRKIIYDEPTKSTKIYEE